jgi:WD40 repeat protein
LVKLWGDPRGGPVARSFSGQQVPPGADGRLILVADGNRAQVWDTATGARVGPDLPHPRPITTGLFAAGGRRLVTVCPGSTPQSSESRVWELPAGRLLAGPVPERAGDLSADGRLFVTFDWNTVQVRQADTGSPVGPALKHELRTVRLAALSPDGRLLATEPIPGDQAGSKVYLWDVVTGRRTRELVIGKPGVGPRPAEYAVVSVEFSADGNRLVTATNLQGGQDLDLIGGGEVRVWDVATGEPVGVPLKHRGRVGPAHFSPDSEGRYVLTTGIDRTVRVWDAATSRPLTPPLAHPAQVTEARFSPDGRYVLTVSDGAARLWDAATGDPVTLPLRGRVYAFAAVFGPDGRSLTVAGVGRNKTEVEVWNLRPDARPAAEWARRARLLAGRELDATGGLVPLPPERLCEELGAPR